MAFKINTRVNRLIQIAAILELVTVLIFVVAAMMHDSAVRLINYTSIAGEILSVLLLLYIISTLGLFGERKSISIAFFIYMIVEFVFSTSVVMLFIIPSSPQLGLISASVLGVLTLLAAIFIFTMSLFIQNKRIFPPLLLYTGSLAAVLILNFLVATVFPLIDPADAGSYRGLLIMRNVINGLSTLSILAPLAIIWLTIRVNQYIRSQQAI